MEQTSNIQHIKIQKLRDGSLDVSFEVETQDNVLHTIYLRDYELEDLMEQVKLAQEVCK